MTMHYYGMDGQEIPIDAWIDLMDNVESRQVALTEFTSDGEDVRVSTVLLGLNHHWCCGDLVVGDPPLIFESMIFGGRLEGYQQRYATKTEAEAGHALAVKAALEVTE